MKPKSLKPQATSRKPQAESRKLRVALLFLCSLLTLHFSLNAQQYGWKNISGNLPDLPYDTVVFGGDTMVSMIRASHFLDDSEGWIVIHNAVDSSFILHTANGGDSWEHRSTHKTAFNDIHMRDQNTGYAGGQDGGIIYKTVDGGYNWNFHWTLGTTLAEIEFPPLPADTGYACGMNGSLMRITPAGGEIVDVNVNSDLHGLSFPVNSREGWLSGWNIVRHYLNGTWYADQVHITGYHNDIEFIDNQTGWTCGDRIMHTGDGYNWVNQVEGDQLDGDLFSISFANAQAGCAVGTVGQVFFTTDGGNNWNKVELGTNEYLIDVQMTSSTCGYITGHGKSIYKYTQVSGEEETGGLGEGEKVEAWPNPTSGVVSLRSAVGSQQSAVIEIVDLFGKVLETHYPEPGIRNLELDLSALPSGIYFIRINLENQTFVKKIMKL
jgi:photosystem II stability/assembly factor-like uncharacterized protein